MIIGLVGFIGSGKGTVGDILVQDYDFIHESFAKPVKDIASFIFGWDREMLEGSTEQSRAWREKPDEKWSNLLEKEFSPRLALQLIGTEIGRNTFHDDFWIKLMQSRVDPNKNYVITDVRFPNEIKFIQENDGLVFHIQRGRLPIWYEDALYANRGSHEHEYNMINVHKVHSSEWKWIGSPVTLTVTNNSSLDDLKKEIKNIMNVYLKR